MNRTDRLVAMVMHLQGRRVVRAEALAAHFAVSVRTIYRDIAALGEAGVPISGEAGVGYCLVKGYNLPPVMLSADEASALFVGAELVKHFTDASLSGPMSAVLDKLRAVLPRDRQEHVERLAQQMIIVGHARQSAPDQEAQPWLVSVQRSVVQRRVLRLGYRTRSRGDETARDVEPLGVVYYRGSWTLVAWCRLRHDMRHFRIDRIRKLTPLDETFPPPPDFSLARHLEERSTCGDVTGARVWLSERAQARARCESYATLVEERRGEHGAEFSLFTSSLEWLAHWLLSFGADAVALEPPRLRELVRAGARAILEAHAAADRDEAVGFSETLLT